MDELEYIDKFLAQANKILELIDKTSVARVVKVILETKKASGRLFILGVGGGAGNASHAVNDFRKIANIESYAPTDNVSELTARMNDDSWDSVFVNWLIGSKVNVNDCVFVLSVGGGNSEKNISSNIVEALKYAKEVGTKIIGIVGRDGGYTARVADAIVVIPTVDTQTITPHTESFQSVIWHLIVSHPLLKSIPMKWESV